MAFNARSDSRFAVRARENSAIIQLAGSPKAREHASGVIVSDDLNQVPEDRRTDNSRLAIEAS